ncbi:uncharacterized protein F5Z01DRAFT_651262 [Emericellopsis atlantica]|uniref:Uncharacterized protein n=1 Tax=Emericellopsis atlantica TaxID=2614577 RepID=A0A9P8CSV4_9HYPO|nr:uncharacterized protein F5Z01DRAFT_651262 [Emericellopsis atlantica]KAG9256156.1 hypothetical protein F5Z01DRAFT_651262 [Emericellopsis atlantica]
MSFLSSRQSLRTTKIHTLPAIRSFSTTRFTSQTVPPDSPDYIRLPLPAQLEQRQRVLVRGFLPVPRSIFPHRRSERKIDGDYLAQTAAKPQSPRTGSSQRQWRAEVAASRRQGLEEGLGELWKRHNRVKTTREMRSRANFQKNHEHRVAPEREDDQYTRGTTLKTLLDTKVYADPNKTKRLEESRQKIMEHNQHLKEVRRDALMELYVSASSFITQESELRKKIDELFHDDYFEGQIQQYNKEWTIANVWGVHGYPPSTANMLDLTSRSMGGGSPKDQSRTGYRQKRIAEEFTGGKMDV